MHNTHKSVNIIDTIFKKYQAKMFEKMMKKKKLPLKDQKVSGMKAQSMMIHQPEDVEELK